MDRSLFNRALSGFGCRLLPESPMWEHFPIPPTTFREAFVKIQGQGAVVRCVLMAPDNFKDLVKNYGEFMDTTDEGERTYWDVPVVTSDILDEGTVYLVGEGDQEWVRIEIKCHPNDE